MEAIPEYYESFPVRKRITSRKRLCIRIDFAESTLFSKGTLLFDIDMKCNGQELPSVGGGRDRNGFTFKVDIDDYNTFPKSGTVTFIQKKMEIATHFNYEIHK
ncbi:hypothetical protein AB1L42_20685 [Thalassoglobus sp. JC818]|uniref:hypothetical protein n=1 Tax=Thalassoglobus sp. JC818 TaxID=3232136 RepID=UPI003457EB9A